MSRVNDLAEMSGYHRTSISRWLSTYRQGGLESLLLVHPKSGRRPKISGEIREQLAQALADPIRFSSYKEVHQWVKSRLGEDVAYKTVHKTVRYGLKAKLKRPRPRSGKQDPSAVETFKKMPQP